MYDMNKYLTKECTDGNDLMKNSIVSICSIVRDCEKNLKKNIPRIESLRGLFKDSEVVIFENDSNDNTLSILKDWERTSSNIHVFSDTFEVPSIPKRKTGEANPYFSISRIEKMVSYRNKYLNYLNTHESGRDFVIVIDLDIFNFSIDGLIHSFGTSTAWDCISANGVSLGANFRSQYHDSYALIEYGKIKDIQTEQSIQANRAHFSYLTKGMPLILVDSAYGGLAVYKWSSIKNTYYNCLINNDRRVQCKSEHVGLHKCMKDNGHSKIFINPNMEVKYRSVSFKFLFLKLKERFLNLFV